MKKIIALFAMLFFTTSGCALHTPNVNANINVSHIAAKRS